MNSRIIYLLIVLIAILIIIVTSLGLYFGLISRNEYAADPIQLNKSFTSSSNRNKNNRVLICYFGLTRSLKYTISSHKNIINTLKKSGMKVDIALHTYNLKELTNKRTNEKNCKLDTEEYKKLNPKMYLITDQDEFLSEIKSNGFFEYACSNGDPWNDEFKSLQNLFCQLNSLKLVTELWNEYDYDVVMYLRPDLLYNELDMNDIYKVISDDVILIRPYINNWFDDRSAIGPPKLMKLYGKRYDYVKEYLDKGKKLHSEEFMTYIVNNKIRNYSHDMKLRGKRVRANGKVHESDKNFF